MFDSSVIDIGIGLVFVFVLLSTAVTAAKEGLEAIFKRRGKDLERGIKELIGWSEAATRDPNSTEAKFISSLYNHPFINSLFSGSYIAKKTSNLPSYIPSANFALALIDLKSQSEGQAPALVLPDKVKKGFAAIEKAVDDDKDKIQKSIEGWYDSSMDRVSGWYKRRTQWWILGIAAVITISVNADSVLIAKRLSTDKTLREAAVSAAQNEIKKPATQPTSSEMPQSGNTSTEGISGSTERSGDQAIETIRTKLSELDGVGFPIGWDADVTQWKKDRQPLASFRDAVRFAISTYPHFPGWALTILAIMLGAPFWFDVLNKFMVVRSTVKPAEKSGEEKSKDPGKAKPR
jgi:hypothetical protein